MSGFADHAFQYLHAGFDPLPVPHLAKKQPPAGYTGHRARQPSGPDIQAWIDDGHASSNIALHLRPGVVSLDFDLYNTGAEARRRELIEKLGPLPTTVHSSSRTDGSGTYLYRVPADVVSLQGSLDGAGETITPTHRYVMAWPSTHPSGEVYRWLDDAGNAVDIPNVDDLPQLPQSWLDHLRKDDRASTVTDPGAAPVALTDGPMSEGMATALRTALDGLRSPGGRHDSAHRHLHVLCRLAEQRHNGVGEAVALYRERFITAVQAERSGGTAEAAREFDSMLETARRDIGQTPTDPDVLDGQAEAAAFLADQLDRVPALSSTTTTSTPARSLQVRRASEMAPAVRKTWLAEGRIPSDQITLLVGAEGIGKSAWWVWLVAKLTTGTPVPEFGLTSSDPQEVVLIITEDQWSTDVLPRLIAAGADLDRIRVVSEYADGEGSPVLPDNLGVLPVDADLVIVDAWSDTLPSNLSVRDQQQARRALHPLKEWCGSTGTAMLLVTHTNRLSTGSTRDAYGATGELRKAARATLLAQAEDAGDGFLTVGTDKSNGARVGVASRFQTFSSTADIGGGEVVDIVECRFIGQADRTAAEQFRDAHESESDQGESKDCTTWLREFLENGNGSAEAKVVQKAAAAQMYSVRALGNAKRALGVVSQKPPVKDGPWLWLLP